MDPAPINADPHHCFFTVYMMQYSSGISVSGTVAFRRIQDGHVLPALFGLLDPEERVPVSALQLRLSRLISRNIYCSAQSRKCPDPDSKESSSLLTSPPPPPQLFPLFLFFFLTFERWVEIK